MLGRDFCRQCAGLNATSFYIFRFLLGIAEAGFFPTIIFYLALWFPKAWLARSIAGFQASLPLAFVFGGPMSSGFLQLEGFLSLHGWQWLFLAEGLPACVFAFVAWRVLPDSPAEANWLSDPERAAVMSRIAAERNATPRNLADGLKDARIYVLGLVGAANQFATIGIQLWAPQIVQSMGASNASVGWIVAVPFLLAAGGMVLWAWSSDRRNDRVWHIAIAAIAGATGFLIAALPNAGNIATLLGISVAIIAQTSIFPIINSLPTTFLRGPAAAGGIALFNMIIQFGGFFGPLALGFVKQQTGGYSGGMLALAIAMTMSAAIVLCAGRAIAPRATVAPVSA